MNFVNFGMKFRMSIFEKFSPTLNRDHLRQLPSTILIFSSHHMMTSMRWHTKCLLQLSLGGLKSLRHQMLLGLFASLILGKKKQMNGNNFWWHLSPFFCFNKFFPFSFKIKVFSKNPKIQDFAFFSASPFANKVHCLAYLFFFTENRETSSKNHSFLSSLCFWMEILLRRSVTIQKMDKKQISHSSFGIDGRIFWGVRCSMN